MGKWNQEINLRYVNLKSPPRYPNGDVEQEVKIQVPGRERSGL